MFGTATGTERPVARSATKRLPPLAGGSVIAVIELLTMLMPGTPVPAEFVNGSPTPEPLPPSGPMPTVEPVPPAAPPPAPVPPVPPPPPVPVPAPAVPDGMKTPPPVFAPAVSVVAVRFAP